VSSNHGIINRTNKQAATIPTVHHNGIPINIKIEMIAIPTQAIIRATKSFLVISRERPF
jgi:hypothetical protein